MAKTELGKATASIAAEAASAIFPASLFFCRIMAFQIIPCSHGLILNEARERSDSPESICATRTIGVAFRIIHRMHAPIFAFCRVLQRPHKSLPRRSGEVKAIKHAFTA